MIEDPFAGLESVLHHPGRIRIMSRLIIMRKVRFSRLRDLTGLSGGNLSSHIEALESPGFVKTTSAVFGRALGKAIEITEAGDAAYRAYVGRLEEALRAMRGDLENGARR